MPPLNNTTTTLKMSGVCTWAMVCRYCKFCKKIGAWRWEKIRQSKPPRGIPVSLTMIPVRNHILVEGFVNDDASFLFDTGIYLCFLCQLIVK